jgi:hypothetical protein
MISTALLRLTAIAAGFSVILLRAWIDPRATALTLLFYLTPYLLIAFAPRRWNATQTGFAAGYSVSMQVAVIVLMVFSLGFNGPGLTSPSPIPPVFFIALRYTNVAVTVAAIVAWLYNRKSINHTTAVLTLVLGIAYPFAAFFLEVLIGGAIYR